MIEQPLFRLNDDEPLGRGIRRVVGELVRVAAGGLEEASVEGLEEVVHDARRAFKKVRAALRLVRPGLPRATFARENTFYRDAGRALSRLRDADVLVLTAGRLGRLTGCERPPAVRALRGRLVQRRDQLREADPSAADPAILAPGLRAAAHRTARWRCTGSDVDVALGGLVASYRVGRTAMERAYGSGTEGALFHAWRKRAKDLRYQLELLQGVWPAIQSAVDVEMHHLTDLLGDANDLDLLRTTLDEDPSLVKGLRDPEAPRRCAEFHRDRLWAEARPVGARLYLESPEQFMERYRQLWRLWRD